jgi:hypothetical protein
MISILVSSAYALPAFTLQQAGQTSREVFCSTSDDAQYDCPAVTQTWPRETGVYTCVDICKQKTKPAFCTPKLACKVRLRFDSTTKEKKVLLAYTSKEVVYPSFWIQQDGSTGASLSKKVTCSSRANPYYGCRSGKELWGTDDATTCAELCRRPGAPAACKANLSCKAAMRYDFYARPNPKSHLLDFKVFTTIPTPPKVPTPPKLPQPVDSWFHVVDNLKNKKTVNIQCSSGAPFDCKPVAEVWGSFDGTVHYKCIDLCKNLMQCQPSVSCKVLLPDHGKSTVIPRKA